MQSKKQEQNGCPGFRAERIKHMEFHTTPFLKVKDAATATGLSQKFLRDGCRAGTIPYIKSGRVIYINVAALLRDLGATAENGEVGA